MQKFLVYLFVGVPSVFFVQAQAATFGRFFPEPPFPKSKKTEVISFGTNPPVEFDKDVTCDTKKCGDIRFDYSTFLEGLTGNNAPLTGGGEIGRAHV